MSLARPRQAIVAVARALRRGFAWIAEAPARLLAAYRSREVYVAKHAPGVEGTAAGRRSEVDEFWGENTVHSTPFRTARSSARYLEWRFEEYPLFREFAGLWGDHDGEVILDYGCGPGNDVTGFLIHTRARTVIGIDVSRKALELTRRRLALHKVELDRVELIHSPDADPTVPLADNSVDYFQSMGVIHITTDPGAILAELHRVLKPGRVARVMVYNTDSIWFHLYTAYVTMILEGKWADLEVEEAFQKTTDGEDCPIARSYKPAEFEELCRGAGFDTRYVGGHLSRHEFEIWSRYSRAAMDDERLAQRHREFLAEIEFDSEGMPTWRGKHAGVGGVYELRS